MTDAFRDLMTHGFYVHDPETGELIEGEERDRILKMTKAWRNDMWRAFQPLDDGLNPIRALNRAKARAAMR